MISLLVDLHLNNMMNQLQKNLRSQRKQMRKENTTINLHHYVRNMKIVKLLFIVIYMFTKIQILNNVLKLALMIMNAHNLLFEIVIIHVILEVNFHKWWMVVSLIITPTCMTVLASPCKTLMPMMQTLPMK